MVSLQFPFLFSQPPSNHPSKSHSPHFAAMAAAATAAAVGFGVGFAVSRGIRAQAADPLLQNPWHFFFPSTQNPSSPIWGSLSLAGNPGESAVEPKTGVSFPATLNDTQRLLGIGLRKKSVLGLKNIDVYAFGVYADDTDVKSLLGEKYGALSVSELKENKDFYEDVLDQDVCMTVRLQIVYGRLSIRSVRSAFEESVGSRLQKFGGSDNKELLQRFTSQFKDEYRIPRGSIIDLSKEQGHILRTTTVSLSSVFSDYFRKIKMKTRKPRYMAHMLYIKWWNCNNSLAFDGKEVGSIQSRLLCRSVLDLYVGEDPFDGHAKEDIELGLASILQK